MELRIAKLEVDVAALRAQLDATLPTLATKADLAELCTELVGLRADVFAALNAQTWKFVGVSLTGSGALVTAVYFVARHAA